MGNPCFDPRQTIFQEGPATAVAVALTTVRGETTDAHQWLVNITLVQV